MRCPSAGLIMGNDARQVNLAGALTRAFCELAGLASLEVAAVELAVVEAVNNVLEHACRHLPSAKIQFTIAIDGDQIVIELRDPGTNLSGVPSPLMPEPLEESGRGWPLILAGVDHLEYRVESGVNVLVMRKRTLGFKVMELHVE